MNKHIILPDLQTKPGVPLNHAEWIGKYIAEKRPDVVVNLGDHADMSSLSTYDRGKLDFEGRRFELDLVAAEVANGLIMSPLSETDHWENCATHILYGNHENRIERFVQDHPELAGFVSKEKLKYADYYDHVHDFLVPVTIDGVTYSHYFYNPNTPALRWHDPDQAEEHRHVVHDGTPAGYRLRDADHGEWAPATRPHRRELLPASREVSRTSGP